MNFDDYQKAANRTLMGNEQVLTNCVLGLTGESGKVADLVRKYTFQSQQLDHDQLVKEMGDVLWYLSQISEWADVPFDEVASDNIKRLKKRYPAQHGGVNQVNI
jgi:NTP pyrophosphatase (non-canonical NTP hydrolase)